MVSGKGFPCFYLSLWCLPPYVFSHNLAEERQQVHLGWGLVASSGKSNAAPQEGVSDF